MSAPGESMSSLWYGGSSSYNLASTNGSSSGTSFAAPCVAAMAVMAKSVWPEITEEEFKTLLQETVTDKGASGYDTSYGYGVVNVGAFADALYAQRTKETYPIRYHLNSGINHAGNPNSYQTDTATITLADPTRGGCLFQGWYTTSDFQDDTIVTQIPTGSSGDVVLYAKWLEQYVLTLDQTDYTFMQAQAGYGEQPAATFTLTGSGCETVTGITVTLEGADASDYFEVAQPADSSLASGATTTFTVKPKTGLAAGTYEAMVAVTGDHDTAASATVSFTVVKVLVTSITVTGADNATTITTKGGVLQLHATVLPSDATDQSVTWTVTSGGSYGSVNTAGLLTALANGSVTVRATAKDGSGICGVITVNISGQTETASLGGGGGGGGGGAVTQYTITTKAGKGGRI